MENGFKPLQISWGVLNFWHFLDVICFGRNAFISSGQHYSNTNILVCETFKATRNYQWTTVTKNTLCGPAVANKGSVFFCFLSLLIRKMLNYIETSVYDNYVANDNVLMFVHRILMGLNRAFIKHAAISWISRRLIWEEKNTQSHFTGIISKVTCAELTPVSVLSLLCAWRPNSFMLLLSFVHERKEGFGVLWLIHTVWHQDWGLHNRKQWVLIHVPVSQQCEHFCIIY